MEVLATIKSVQEPQSGTSQAGNEYKRQTVIVEYGDKYPKIFALTLMNDKCDQYSQYLTIGQRLKFFFDISSREYNGRYYTECIVWRIEPTVQQQEPTPMPTSKVSIPKPVAPMPNYAPITPTPMPTPPQPSIEDDGLPF